MRLGSEGLAKAAEKAEALGVAVSRVDAAKIEESRMAWSDIGTTIDGIFNRIAVAIAPFVTAVANAFTSASTEARGFGDAIDSAVKIAISIVGFFADAWQGVTLAFQAGRVAVAILGSVMADLGNTAVQVAQWIAAKFSQAWELISASFSVLWSALNVGWSGMRVAVADFVSFAGSQIASLMRIAADAAYQFSAEQGSAMQAAADAVQVSVGAMSANARIALDKNVAGITAASDRMAAATSALFSSVHTEGSAMLTGLRADFAALADEEMKTLDAQRNQPLASDRIAAAAAEIQTEAQLRAEARAAELVATQVQSDARNAIETDGWISYYDWSQQSAEKDSAYRSRLLSSSLANSSSFFGNLSKLQDSHSKKARAIGDAAAKAKIVSDTASAAMASYSALAGIPIVGPYLGAAAAAAAVVAGSVQLANVGKSSIGSSAVATQEDVSTSNVGGVSAPRNTQTLVLQGDSFSAESLTRLFDDAKERGITIDGVRRA
jgi:hypothetical protein